MADFVCTPTKKIAETSERGGPGNYDGANDNGFQPRTSSPNGVPEVFTQTIQGAGPGSKGPGN